MTAFQRDLVLCLLLALTLTSCYSANEAHDHAHEVVNACSPYDVYDRNGGRLP